MWKVVRLERTGTRTLFIGSYDKCAAFIGRYYPKHTNVRIRARRPS